MDADEKIQLYQEFDEGTEIGDIVESLLTAARGLRGLGLTHELSLTLIIVEKMLKDYFIFMRDSWPRWEDYDKINDKLYQAIMDEKKLTLEEWQDK